MAIRKVAGALGSEISGVDLLEPLGDRVAAELRAVSLEHKAIFFRRQSLSPDEFLAFARAFGQPIEYPFVKGLEGYPEIIEVKKLEHERVNFGGVWHSDTTCLEVPPMGTMLLSK